MTSPPDALAAHALPHLMSLEGERKLVAIAGPPGSGKPTISETLCAVSIIATGAANIVRMTIRKSCANMGSRCRLAAMEIAMITPQWKLFSKLSKQN